MKYTIYFFRVPVRFCSFYLGFLFREKRYGCGLVGGVLSKKLSVQKIHRLLLLTALCFVPIGLGLLLGVSAMVGYIILTASCLMAIILCAQPVGQWLAGWSFEHFAALPWLVLLAASVLTSIVCVYSRSCFRKISV